MSFGLSDQEKFAVFENSFTDWSFVYDKAEREYILRIPHSVDFWKYRLR